MKVGDKVKLTSGFLGFVGEETTLGKGTLGIVIEVGIQGPQISVSWEGLTSGHNNGEDPKGMPNGNNSAWIVPEASVEVIE